MNTPSISENSVMSSVFPRPVVMKRQRLRWMKFRSNWYWMSSHHACTAIPSLGYGMSAKRLPLEGKLSHEV